MQSKATNQLTFPHLPTASLNCHEFDKVDLPLCSVGKFCDNGMRVLFDINNVWIIDTESNDTLLTSYRDPTTKLYMIPLDQPTPYTVPRVPDPFPATFLRVLPVPLDPPPMGPPPSSGFSTYKVQSVSSLINYLHRTCCCLPISTWIEAVNRDLFTGWPGLSSKRIRKYCTKKEEMTIGHQKLIRQNIRSTQPKPPPEPRSKIHDCGVFILNTDDIKSNCYGSNRVLPHYFGPWS